MSKLIIHPEVLPPNPRPRPKPTNGWKKGQSGNPKGRIPHPRVNTHIASMCREYTPMVMGEFVRMFMDKKTSPAMKYAIGKDILDRGYGRAPQALFVDANVNHNHNPLQAMTEQQMAEIMAAVREVQDDV